MIEFTCPGCRSQCVANEAFRGMRARCVVCGAFIRIPKESGEIAFPLGPIPSGPLPTRPRRPQPAQPPKPSLPAKPPGAPGAAPRSAPADGAASPVTAGETEEGHTDDVFPLAGFEPGGDEPKSPTTKGSAKGTKRAAKKAPRSADPAHDWNALADDADQLDEAPQPDKEPDEEPPARPPESQAKPALTPEQKRKRTFVIVGGSVLASVVIACVLAFTGGDPPKPVVTAPPRDDPAPEPPKPSPKPPEPKVELPPPTGIEVAPHPRVGGTPTRAAAAQLVTERTARPVAFDEENRGKLYLVRGTYARTVNGVLYLADGTDDTVALACVPPRLSLKGPLEPPPEAALLQPGQAVIVRGWYAAGLRLTDCRVVATAGPADEEYRDKTIDLVGTVGSALAVDPEGGEKFPTVVLEPTATDCPVSVRCLFRITEREKMTALRPGQLVTVRGRCEGRSFRVVRLHNCALVPNEDTPLPGIPRVPAERFFAAYEIDLLPFTRPDPAVPPVAATAEVLAGAYGTNPALATATYGHRAVILTGRVLERRATSHTVVFETGTHQKYQVAAVFTPSRYAQVKNFPELTVRGVCAGPSGRYVRVENADAVDPESGNPAVRTTAEFLPLTPDRELLYDVLTPTPREYALTRYAVRVLDTGAIRTTPLRGGTYSKPTLFADTPGQAKWTRDLTKQKAAATLAQFRVSEGTVELRERPAPPAQPGTWWDPIFKIGLRKGETWSSTMSDGRTVTYTVGNFGKDAARRHTIDVVRVVKNPKEPAMWEESVVTYARGVGEIRRVTTRHSTSGKAFTVMELKLVETDPELKSDPEPAKDGNRDDK